MKLRCKVGQYAGHLIDYPDEVGRMLLKYDRAERPDEAEGKSVEQAMPPEPTKRRRKRRRK